MKVLKKHWFTNGKGCVGVVQCRDDDGNRVYYISRVDGGNEEYDARYIADYGARFPWAAGEVLFEERGLP